MSDSLILTGIAIVDREQVATLMDKNSKKTYVVSTKPNSQGWTMVGIDGGGTDDLETVTARISLDGSTTVQVRYDEMSLKPGEAKPAGGPGGAPGKGGLSLRKPGDGSDLRAKIMSLPEDQRNKLFSKMREMHQKNPGMSPEDRRAKFEEMANKLTGKKN